MATQNSGGATVQLVELHRQFGSTKALDGLSLDIASGELVALLGPSGCGKTTALRVLAGFERQDRGSVVVDGRDVTAVAPQKRDMGMVFQSYSLFPNLSALDNVAFGLRMRGMGTRARRQRATELLDMVGLGDRGAQYPHQLSGGQQQRVALARALAIQPRVLLLDEPLSALDAQVRVGLREQIRHLQAQLGTTTVFVTHDQEEALSMADRVCVMRNGRIEQVATPERLYGEPETAFVAEFVGTMNRVPGHVDGDSVEVLGRRLAVRNPNGHARGALVDVLLRPEHLTLQGGSGSSRVLSKAFLGSVSRVVVQLAGETTVKIDLASEAAAGLSAGDQVDVTAHDAQVMIADPHPGNGANGAAPADGGGAA
jgi:putative spermidine/putrescine transport system ATP-binding protein